MKTYIYTDNSTKTVLIKIKANSIFEADKKFKEKFGFDVSKKAFIGCQIKS